VDHLLTLADQIKQKTQASGKEVIDFESFVDRFPPQSCVREYAHLLNLSEDYIKSLGLEDVVDENPILPEPLKEFSKHFASFSERIPTKTKALRIPYYDLNSNWVYDNIRIRTYFSKTKPFLLIDKRITEQIPYGLWKKDSWQQQRLNYVVVVDSEMDVQILWYHNIPAFGVLPSNWVSNRIRWLNYFRDFQTIYVNIKPQDMSGKIFLDTVSPAS
jgi:hypothetical protein